MAGKRVQSNELVESLHKVWLAGLGGLSVAEEEGGKLFESLVKRGERYEVQLARRVKKLTSSVRNGQPSKPAVRRKTRRKTKTKARTASKSR